MGWIQHGLRRPGRWGRRPEIKVGAAAAASEAGGGARTAPARGRAAVAGIGAASASTIQHPRPRPPPRLCAGEGRGGDSGVAWRDRPLLRRSPCGGGGGGGVLLLRRRRRCAAVGVGAAGGCVPRWRGGGRCSRGSRGTGCAEVRLQPAGVLTLSWLMRIVESAHTAEWQR